MFKIALKFIFAFAIVGWLFKSGKLDFSLVQKGLSSGLNWLWCILILAGQAILSGQRWRLLLQVKSKKPLSFFEMTRLTWIGLFFNSFLPGAVTGDLIKLVYARDLDKSLSKTFLVTTVLMDRVIGLMGLLCILGVFSGFYYNDIVILSPQMKGLIHFNFLLFAAAIVFIVLLFLPKKQQDFFLELSRSIPLLGHRIHKTLAQIWAFGEDKTVLFKTLTLSIFLQGMNLSAFWIISSPFYEAELPFPYVMTFIPIGLMAVAFPISPMGLGVGHVVFDKLFNWASISGGAGFFNLFFLCIVFINSFGVLPYILSGRRHKLEEVDQFSDANI